MDDIKITDEIWREIGLKDEVMDADSNKKESKRSKMLFEALMIYLACWYKKEWKMSDFYGKKGEKGFILGRKNLYKATRSRINLLKKNNIPIVIERVNKYAIKEGSRVWIDRKQVLQDFKEEIEYNVFDKGRQELILSVIKLALPHLEFQIDYYYQKKQFFSDWFRRRLEILVDIYQNNPKTIKYLPILLSFNYSIDAGKEVKEQRIRGLTFRELLDLSFKKGLLAQILNYFFLQIAGVKELMKNFSDNNLRMYVSFSKQERLLI